MIKRIISVRVGADEKGDRERRPVRKDGLQQPNGLKHSLTTSHRRYYGEARRGKRHDTLKTMLEHSVSTLDQPGNRLECCQSLATEWQLLGRLVTSLLRLLIRIEKQSAQPGSELSTCGIKGQASEHETLKLSAAQANVRQASWTGKVSAQEQSLRSSQSAGKPRTGRRETVDAYN